MEAGEDRWGCSHQYQRVCDGSMLVVSLSINQLTPYKVTEGGWLILSDLPDMSDLVTVSRTLARPEISTRTRFQQYSTTEVCPSITSFFTVWVSEIE